MVARAALYLIAALPALVADREISGPYVRGLTLTDEARKICGERFDTNEECRQFEVNALREIARIELWRLQCMSYRDAINPPSWTNTAACYEVLDRPLPSPEEAYDVLEHMSRESVLGLPWREE